jgi:hypothetical protein
MSVACRVVAGGGVLLLIACQNSLPMAPSELAYGIVVYQHVNYGGKSGHVSTNIADLQNISGPCFKPEDGDDAIESWDDCISSVRIASGYRAILFGDLNYRGLQLEVTADLPDLRRVPDGRDLNDGMSSIRIFPP